MNKISVVIIMLLAVIMAGCSTTVEQTQEEGEVVSNPTIVTSFYPVEEITKAIVQDTATVEVLVGTGVEPHSFEPSAQQVVKFSNANIFVTMEGMFEHVEEEMIDSNSNIIVIEAAHNLKLIKGGKHDEHHDEHEEEDHNEEKHDEHDDHNHGEYDPHVWLSIHNMEKMTEEITEHLVELYPQNKELYERNAQAYINQLETLEEEYEVKLSSCKYEEIIVNHKAFGYLAHEYGFEQVGVAGFSPESEPTPKTIQAVIDEAREHNLTVVFSEGQIDSKTAKTIANDINGQVLELNPLRLNDNEDYFSIMRANLNNLAIGLNCK